jgi:hypothetical protein
MCGAAVRCRTAAAILETDSTKYDYYDNIIFIEMFCCLDLDITKMNRSVNNLCLELLFLLSPGNFFPIRAQKFPVFQRTGNLA